jgi:hypothetical protein
MLKCDGLGFSVRPTDRGFVLCSSRRRRGGIQKVIHVLRARFKALRSCQQGNRVKKLCGDEACKEVVIPGGDFAAESDGIISPGSPD